MTGPGLRLMVYDRTDGALSHAWRAGSLLYHGLGRLDGSRGAASWGEALDWLVLHRAGEAIAEIQLWMHGLWGCALIGGKPLSRASLAQGHPFRPRLDAIRARLSRESLWWFRTCQTFGTDAGQAFARAWTRFFECRAAGHTFDIGVLQSGLRVLGPEDEPTWPVSEGVDRTRPGKALPSRWRAPKTITCLHGSAR